MIAAYADPPYPGSARRIYRCEEVDHAHLLEDLARYDAWSQSTGATRARARTR